MNLFVTASVFLSCALHLCFSYAFLDASFDNAIFNCECSLAIVLWLLI